MRRFPPSFSPVARLLALLMLTPALLCCERRDEGVVVDLPAEEEVSIIRVVSLAPALTQIMVDMGNANLLVGVAENDAAAPKGLPVVGNYLDIDSEALVKVRPTHVLMMTGKEGAPERLAELALKHRFELVTYPSPTSVDEVARIIYNEDERKLNPELPARASLGEVLGSDKALELKFKVVAELARISGAVA